jgi:hypothetical protein
VSPRRLTGEAVAPSCTGLVGNPSTSESVYMSTCRGLAGGLALACLGDNGSGK